MEKNWWQEANFDFIRIPKELFRNPYYGTLSAESKLLYGFLLDRVSLSWLNGEKWRTPEGEPFVIYTLAEIQQRLGCGEKKAGKLLKALTEHHLIRLNRPKKDGPYHIFVLPFARSKTPLPNGEKDTCTDVERAVAHPSKVRHNHTERNDTEKNITDKITLLEREIKTQIEYDILLSEFPRQQLDSIVEVMVQVLSSPAKTITVGGLEMDAQVVKGYLRKVGPMRIQYVCHHQQDMTSPILSYRAYYLARLFDPESAVDDFYELF